MEFLSPNPPKKKIQPCNPCSSCHIKPPVFSFKSEWSVQRLWPVTITSWKLRHWAQGSAAESSKELWGKNITSCALLIARLSPAEASLLIHNGCFSICFSWLLPKSPCCATSAVRSWTASQKAAQRQGCKSQTVQSLVTLVFGRQRLQSHQKEKSSEIKQKLCKTLQNSWKGTLSSAVVEHSETLEEVLIWRTCLNRLESLGVFRRENTSTENSGNRCAWGTIFDQWLSSTSKEKMPRFDNLAFVQCLGWRCLQM